MESKKNQYKFGHCENVLCAYRVSRKEVCGLYLYQNLINQCKCRSDFLKLDNAIKIDREFGSGSGTYHKWKEITDK